MTDSLRKESNQGRPLLGLHHVAIIASGDGVSKRFYVELL